WMAAPHRPLCARSSPWRTTIIAFCGFLPRACVNRVSAVSESPRPRRASPSPRTARVSAGFTSRIVWNRTTASFGWPSRRSCSAFRTMSPDLAGSMRKVSLSAFPQEGGGLLLQAGRDLLLVDLAGHELVSNRPGEGVRHSLTLRERLRIGGFEGGHVGKGGCDHVGLGLGHPRNRSEKT